MVERHYGAEMVDLLADPLLSESTEAKRRS